jgi:hypothetical protein
MELVPGSTHINAEEAMSSVTCLVFLLTAVVVIDWSV